MCLCVTEYFSINNKVLQLTSTKYKLGDVEGYQDHVVIVVGQELGVLMYVKCFVSSANRSDSLSVIAFGKSFMNMMKRRGT